MELSFTSKDLEFRDEVRDFLANEYPSHIKEKLEKGDMLSKQDLIDWHKSVSNKGWMGYNWPKNMVEQVVTCTNLYFPK